MTVAPTKILSSSPSDNSGFAELEAQYELITPIGEGGMGTVWRAHDRRLDVDVAIKVVHEDNECPQAVQRFLTEARAAAQVRHPSAVRVLGTGLTRDSSPFIVMELLEGDSLEQLLDARGTLPATEAIGVLLPIVRAVAAAHEQGIIHRDIKPANILMSRQRSGHVIPKLLDFGIAKQTVGTSVSVTLPGTIMGTPSYMAPEQACGRDDVDRRADVWALCAVAYELVAGRPPFVGDNYNAVISAVLIEPAIKPDLMDDALWSIVHRGLSKKRQLRWPDARVLGEQLARWLLREGHEHDITRTALRNGSLFPPGRRPTTAPPPQQGEPSTAGLSLPPRDRPRLSRDRVAGLARRHAVAAIASAGMLTGLVAGVALWPSGPPPLATHALHSPPESELRAGWSARQAAASKLAPSADEAAQDGGQAPPSDGGAAPSASTSEAHKRARRPRYHRHADASMRTKHGMPLPSQPSF